MKKELILIYFAIIIIGFSCNSVDNADKIIFISQWIKKRFLSNLDENYHQSSKFFVIYHSTNKVPLNLNLKENPYAVINFTDDVNIFVDALLGKKNFEIKPTKKIKSFYLKNTLSYFEIKVIKSYKNKIRPKFECKILKKTALKSFKGFNRAQSSIIEAAILVSRIKIIPMKKIKKEFYSLLIKQIK